MCDSYPLCKEDTNTLKELVKLAEKYPEGDVHQFKSLVGGYQYKFLYRSLRKYVPQGAEVLDWGVGNGHFSYFLVRSGYKAFGFSLDGFPIGVELADARYRFVKGGEEDPTRLPFKDNSFACVSSVGVLEHVRQTGGNEEASLMEIVRILKPGGVFICCHLPNRYSFVEAVARFFPRKHHHPYRYVEKNIKSLVEKTKLQLLETKRYGFLPRNTWCYAPKFLKNLKASVIAWDILDTLLSYPFAFLCQNYIFVARKPK